MGQEGASNQSAARTAFAIDIAVVRLAGRVPGKQPYFPLVTHLFLPLNAPAIAGVRANSMIERKGINVHYQSWTMFKTCFAIRRPAVCPAC